MVQHLRTVAAVFRKEWINMRRYPTWVVAMLVWPALFPAMYVFMARALSGPDGRAVAVFSSVTGTDDYVGYLLFGTTLWMILNTALWSLGSYLRREQIRGTLESTWTTPASRLSMMLGAAVMQMVSALIFLTVTLTVVRLLYGFELRGDVGTLLALLVLSLLPVSGLGILFASLVVWLKEINALVFLVRGVFMVFAGMTYPIEVLPPWMRAVSEALPLTHSIRALRLVGLAGAGWRDVQYEITMLALFSVVFIVLGLAAFLMVERFGQRAGTLAHY